MDLAVIYDPETEMSALVDTDTFRALGPVGVGPQSQTELRQFVSLMPEAVMDLDTYRLSAAWSQFWEKEFKPLHEQAIEGGTGAVVAPSDPDGDAAALAAREAVANADGPPAEQPADTDMEAHESAPPKIVDCFACNGVGRVPGATEGAEVVCNLCGGHGKIQEPATA